MSTDMIEQLQFQFEWVVNDLFPETQFHEWTINEDDDPLGASHPSRPEWIWVSKKGVLFGHQNPHPHLGYFADWDQIVKYCNANVEPLVGIEAHA